MLCDARNLSPTKYAWSFSLLTALSDILFSTLYNYGWQCNPQLWNDNLLAEQQWMHQFITNRKWKKDEQVLIIPLYSPATKPVLSA